MSNCSLFGGWLLHFSLLPTVEDLVFPTNWIFVLFSIYTDFLSLHTFTLRNTLWAIALHPCWWFVTRYWHLMNARLRLSVCFVYFRLAIIRCSLFRKTRSLSISTRCSRLRRGTWSTFTWWSWKLPALRQRKEVCFCERHRWLLHWVKRIQGNNPSDNYSRDNHPVDNHLPDNK